MEARTAAGEAVALLYDTCGLAELDDGSAQDSGCARCHRASSDDMPREPGILRSALMLTLLALLTYMFQALQMYQSDLS